MNEVLVGVPPMCQALATIQRHMRERPDMAKKKKGKKGKKGKKK